MKKAIIFLLVLLLCLSLCACGEPNATGTQPTVTQPTEPAHIHQWAEADCVNPKTCPVCGETEGEALGHNWQDATCTAPKTCSVCEVTEGEALGHSWQDATCELPKTCSVCGATEGDALGHSWDDATCELPKTCSVCGATEGEALGHTWADANCTTPKICSVCGETEGEALGHAWADANCRIPKTCYSCCEAEGEALGHTWVDATCEKPKTCSVCKATEGEALEHNWVQGSCSYCGISTGGDGSATLRHAPNMYVDWITDKEYDVISVDWYCEEDALDTYWAVHQWEEGYAGFQNKNGNHVLLLSLWDLPDGTTPTVEYVLGGQNGDFGGEGTGKNVFTNYGWKVGQWYSMCIRVSSDDNKTYYTQYVKAENGDWLKTAVISYPVAGKRFYGSSVFQEDFSFNNLKRSCRLRNACGRVYGTEDWESWNQCIIKNSFFPTDDATWENGVQINIDFNCDLENCGDYVWIQSGGEGFASNGKQIPAEYTLNNAEIPPKSFFENYNEPDQYEEPIAPDQVILDGTYVIATKLNQNYVLTIAGAGKAPGDNVYLWVRNNSPAQLFQVTYLGNGFYRIVNLNSGKAIDAEYGGTEPGTNVWQYDVNDSPAQTWKIVSGPDNSYYIINQESELYLDVENADADIGTNIQLFVYDFADDAHDAQEWLFIRVDPN